VSLADAEIMPVLGNIKLSSSKVRSERFSAKALTTNWEFLHKDTGMVVVTCKSLI
jgi:hypothetical protein